MTTELGAVPAVRENHLGDDEETLSPESPELECAQVMAACFSDPTAEKRFVDRWTRRATRTGAVAILVPESAGNRNWLESLGTPIPSRDFGVPIGGRHTAAFHRAKGMEFDSVAIARLDEGSLPFSFDAHAGPVRSTEKAASALVVAITRAKRELLVTCTGTPSTYMPWRHPDVEMLETDVIATIEDLGIDRVCHLTAVRNLAHILADGAVLPPATLAERGLVLNANDHLRLDGRRDATSASIGVPNGYYLRSVRDRTAEFNDWCVLLLHPDVLAFRDVEFSTTNAAAERAQRGTGSDALRLLYEHPLVLRDGRIYPRGMTHAPTVPTDIQAEVLIGRPISTSFVQGVVFADELAARREIRRIALAAPGCAPPPFFVSPEWFDVEALTLAVRSGGVPEIVELDDADLIA